MSTARRSGAGAPLGPCPDIEYRADRAKPCKARVRWVDPTTKKRLSTSETFETEDEAKDWVARMERAAAHGLDPHTATMSLADYGDATMELALRGLEAKTTDPYKAGWRKRIVPTLGHIPVSMLTNGAVDRAVNPTLMTAQQAGEDPLRGGLAGPVRAEELEDLPFLDGERDPVHRYHDRDERR